MKVIKLQPIESSQKIHNHRKEYTITRNLIEQVSQIVQNNRTQQIPIRKIIVKTNIIHTLRIVKICKVTDC